MEEKEIIEKIVKNESLVHSKELLTWIQRSTENRKEYIRYKNLWALLQQGHEMNEKMITEDFLHVKARMKKSRSRFIFSELVKYAAIIVLALATGYFLNYILSNSGQQITTNEISVPNGNRSLVILPDGSKVWITNGSKLTYPEKFKGKTREINLEGEAFFTITADKKKPFFVHLGAHRIKVLGTEFSVVAYPDDQIIRVDLVSGKVQMDVNNGKNPGTYQSFYLEPLHSLVMDKQSGKLKESAIPDGFYKYWQNGIYEFKNESFKGLAVRMERIYGVDVIFEDNNISQRTFTGAFRIDSNIYTIMETFKRASGRPFDYTMDNNRIYIKSVK
ncbi:MAG: FecR family protein [Bacteroidales bacterium]